MCLVRLVGSKPSRSISTIVGRWDVEWRDNSVPGRNGRRPGETTLAVTGTGILPMDEATGTHASLQSATATKEDKKGSGRLFFIYVPF